MARTPKKDSARTVEALVHADSRRNIPTAELQSIAQQMEEAAPVGSVRYPRATPLPQGEVRERNADLDPQIIWRGVRFKLTEEQRARLLKGEAIELGEAQLVWRGKDAQDWSDLVVNPPPIYIQEKVHPKAIIESLRKEARARAAATERAPDLFADFNGLDDPEARLEFYQHDQHWSNRMILGDSLQVMASLAEREGLRGKVQCIYFDPPYGIKFNSNWQVSTLSRDVKDGKREDISREPEQVKAFRDTWKDGIHSYLSYLRERLTSARQMLAEQGSIFVQIGDENVHRVRALLDEVFGEENCCAAIFVLKTTGAGSPAVSTDVTPSVGDYVLWYAKDISAVKYRRLYKHRRPSDDGNYRMGRECLLFDRSLSPKEMVTVDELPSSIKIFSPNPLTSQTGGATTTFPYSLNGQTFVPSKGGWKTNLVGLSRLGKANRLLGIGNTLRYLRMFEDFPYQITNNLWDDVRQSGFGVEKVYVVQTTVAIVARCILMASDPGDLFLDPTCGSGTTAAVAEQWGRRWITIDTSRVALALARTRLMAAKYNYYLLFDTPEGRAKEREVSGQPQPNGPTNGDIRYGFVYERAPHVTLKSIANNAEIDVLWDAAHCTLEPLRENLNVALGTTWEEWQVPREADPAWPPEIRRIHTAWWEARVERQRRIDASIARRADVEILYDRPYEDRSRIRVAGPFTVESLSPHRVVPADEDYLFAAAEAAPRPRRAATPPTDFAAMVMDHLRTAGVHQSRKADSIRFTSLTPWPGDLIGAEGR